MLAAELKMGGGWCGRSRFFEAYHTATSAGSWVMVIDEGLEVGDEGI